MKYFTENPISQRLIDYSFSWPRFLHEVRGFYKEILVPYPEPIFFYILAFTIKIFSYGMNNVTSKFAIIRIIEVNI